MLKVNYENIKYNKIHYNIFSILIVTLFILIILQEENIIVSNLNNVESYLRIREAALETAIYFIGLSLMILIVLFAKPRNIVEIVLQVVCLVVFIYNIYSIIEIFTRYDHILIGYNDISDWEMIGSIKFSLLGFDNIISERYISIALTINPIKTHIDNCMIDNFVFLILGYDLFLIIRNVMFRNSRSSTYK
jgi:hypothetical protein